MEIFGFAVDKYLVVRHFAPVVQPGCITKLCIMHAHALILGALDPTSLWPILGPFQRHNSPLLALPFNWQPYAFV